MTNNRGATPPTSRPDASPLTPLSPPSALPVAVIGAGPVGLAAAAHLVRRGTEVVVLEAGLAAGAHVQAWGHVRVFSPWRYNVDPVAREMLLEAGWREPDPDHLPSGAELVHDYLAPLAALPAIAARLRVRTRVLAVSRRGLDKLTTPRRDATPFVLHLRTTDGREETLLARAVIDASGTYGSPNPLGAGGVPAAGERQAAARVFYGIPDVLGALRARYAGRRVLVIGSGHSAFNTLLDLAALAEHEPATRIVWAIRRTERGNLFGGGAADALPARGELGTRMRELVAAGRVRLVTSFRVARLEPVADGVVVEAEDGRRLDTVDEVVCTTGFRPDLAMLGELRLALDPTVESTATLAPLIDPNLHSCGTVPPHGEAELAHPERDFYVVGMKSYGRAPTFLMLTGYEQVRSVACALTGDPDGARKVELTLPETGVCSAAVPASAGATACCGTEPTPAGSSCCATEPPASATTSCCGTEPTAVATTSLRIGAPKAGAR
jgi:glycine/D-amino acid oxidase-like deaminating enzyme